VRGPRICIATVWILLSTLAAAAPPIRAHLVVTKADPHRVEVYVTVTPAPENAGYLAELACDGHDASTFRQLEGARSAGPFQPVVWREVPDGECQVRVTLFSGAGPIASATHQLRIGFGRGDDVALEP
jgi:hypothetical protein